MRHRTVAPTALAALVLSGCLLPKPPDAPRVYAPSTSVAAGDPMPARPVVARLAPVRSPIHLREAVTWRRSDVEYGFYEQRRWTEPPASYVERAIVRELFAVERAPLAVDVTAPVVTAEVVAFEDVLEPAHQASVAVGITVVDGRCVRLRQVFAATRPLGDEDGATLARGIGEALDDVVHRAGDAVRRALAERGRCA